jgi:hypothetical protein
MAVLMKLEPLRNQSKPHLLPSLFHSILFFNSFSLSLLRLFVFMDPRVLCAEEEESVLL